MDEQANPYDFQELEPRWQARWEAEKTFRTPDDSPRPKHYCLEMFPYPSGSGLHVGHLKNYVPVDAYCRYKHMKGFNVLHPMGWDAFGQPAENEAIKRGRNPKEMVPEYAANYKRTLQKVGCAYDWDREINSSEPEYYHWTQWIFQLLFERGLAYRDTAAINWCPSCKTGLANEEVKEGRCWRCSTPIEKRPMPQWFFRITAYAGRLLTDLDKIDWPDGVKEMQRDWIGRSEGAEVDFGIAGGAIRVFTTRPDTLFGATFMVLAPEHPLVEGLVTAEQRHAVDAYRKKAAQQTDIDRMNAERVKTGVFTGAYAVNPVNQEKIPIWVADYVLMGYGTGAIMAVPAHDQRDFEFARKYGLQIRMVYRMEGGPVAPEAMTQALPHDGVVVNSGKFDGLPNTESTIQAFIAWLEEKGVGRGKVNYRLRDWLISRQRYWGCPIPIIHCDQDGMLAAPLPVLLPDVVNYEPTGTGESPLASIPDFVNTTCPKCGGPARRETDTMGGYACSSWYPMRYADPHNAKAFASREKVDKWMPVDLYVGGTEHARSHLLYARFWTKVLYDAGYVGIEEPFTALRNQGSMLAYTPGRKPKAGELGEGEADDETLVDWILLKPEERDTFPKDDIVWRWARMSKSKYNAVTPDDMASRFGADSLRLYEMFVAPFEDNVQWSEEGITGSFKWANRVWRWAVAALPSWVSGWRAISSDNVDGARKIRRTLHQTLKKVGGDVEGFRFNTAISAMHSLVNDVYAWRPLETLKGPDAQVSEVLELLVLMLAPFAPHMAEELWSRMGQPFSVYDASWPAVDEKAAAEDEITYVIQINSKVRDRIVVPIDTPVDSIKAKVLHSAKVQELLANRTVRNVVVVPHKLVNIIV
ncbi:MAG TPA: leucine--tRNA ligase [Candidatus Xenobia bacterium]|jgi:leucyl-tRNA synthetase